MGIVIAVTVVLASLYVSGYDLQTIEDKYEVTKKEQIDVSQTKVISPPVIVRVTGYGAFQNPKDRQSESKRLMVLRASKLDAYRNLAERIYGTSISGQTTVEDFKLKHDGVASMVDSVVRGAKVVSITEHKEKGIETVLELILPGDFQACLNKVNNFVNGKDCLRAMPNDSIDALSLGVERASASGRRTNSSRMGQNYYLH